MSQAPYNGKAISVPDFASSLNALVAKVGAPKYLNRRVSAFPGGFVEQHTSQLTSPRGVVYIEACLVAHTDAAGKIVLLEEYLDPKSYRARL